MKVGDKVKPASRADAFAIGCGFVKPVTVDTEFEVLIVVKNAVTYECGLKYPATGKKQASGLIIKHSDDIFHYPYVWDFKRFIHA
jgi:hypothetical protein